jgi:hypothetical protein
MAAATTTSTGSPVSASTYAQSSVRWADHCAGSVTTAEVAASPSGVRRYLILRHDMSSQ